MMADETKHLRDVLKERVDVVTGLIKAPQMEKAEKDAKIIAAVETLIDFPLMARLSLGKKAWMRLDRQSRKRYTELFVKRVKGSYLEKLYLYTDEEVVVERGKRGKKNRIIVPSYIIGKTDKTEVLYKFYRSKGGKWLVYDLEIAGVSVTQTYRAQFAEILKHDSVDALIAKLDDGLQQ